MKKVLFVCCFIMAFCACGNTKPTEQTTETKSVVEEQGTVFFDITLEEALEKAKAQNKYVFINFHTKTCGPCKKMEKFVFPKPECGKYINEHFVPIVIDGEDGGVGQEIAKKYQVSIFPTYLILQPDGFKEGEILGAESDINVFLGIIKTIIHDKEETHSINAE